MATEMRMTLQATVRRDAQTGVQWSLQRLLTEDLCAMVIHAVGIGEGGADDHREEIYLQLQVAVVNPVPSIGVVSGRYCANR